MIWYKSGRVNVVYGLAVVTGVETAWVDNVLVGDAFIGPDNRTYEIIARVSDTELQINPPYAGTTLSEQNYQILPTTGRTKSLADQASDLLNSFGEAEEAIEEHLAGISPHADGALHVPPTGTTSAGKALVAKESPGSAEWKKLEISDVDQLADSLSGKANSSDVESIAKGAIAPEIAQVGEAVATVQQLAESVQGVAGNSNVALTLAELRALTGVADKAGGKVTSDNLTHVDPVSGQTVSNNGEYRYLASISDWQWLTPLALDVAATKKNFNPLNNGVAGANDSVELPNAFDDKTFEKWVVGTPSGYNDPVSGIRYIVSSGTTVSRVRTDDFKDALRVVYTAANGIVRCQVPVGIAGIVEGDRFSASVSFVAGSVVGTQRVLLRQLNSERTEVSSASVGRGTVVLPQGNITDEYLAAFSGITRLAATAFIEFYIDTNTVGGILAFNKVSLQKGLNPMYREAIKPLKSLISAEVVAAVAGAGFATTAQLETKGDKAPLSKVYNAAVGSPEIFDFPNGFADNDFKVWPSALPAGTVAEDGSIYRKSTGATAEKVTLADGSLALKFVATAASGNINALVPVANIGGSVTGDLVSASLTCKGGNALGVTRVMLRQLNSTLQEVSSQSAGRGTFTFPVGVISDDTVVEFKGVQQLSGVAYWQVYIDSNTVDSQLSFNKLSVQRGTNPAFRPGIVPMNKLVKTQVAAAIAAGGYATASQVDSRISASLVSTFDEPNRINNDWAKTILTGSPGGTREAVEFGGKPALKVTVGSPSGEWYLDFPVTDFPNGKFAFSVNLMARSHAGTTSNPGGRILIRQLTTTSSTSAISAKNLELKAPLGATLPYNLAVADTIDPSAVWIRVWFSPVNAGALATDYCIYQDALLAKGSNTVYRPSVDISSSKSFAYIASSGNDNTGDGSLTSPFKSINRAATLLKGVGTIFVNPGEYTPDLLTPSLVVDLKIVGLRPLITTNKWNYPLMRLNTAITGITKTEGSSKIYQAAVSGLPTLANFQWAYQDGVPDPRTLIADEDRDPEHRGRTNRLMFFSRLMKTTATTLATAKAEMDASSLPLAFIDGGVLYFTIVGGGDGTAASIYVDREKGLVDYVNSSSTYGHFGKLSIIGMDFLYGGLDLRPFRESYLHEVSSHGARGDNIAYYNLTYGNLEGSCSGSFASDTGDVLNGHYGARLLGVGSLYLHDGNDDAFSDHEGCVSRLLSGGLVEYSGGAGICPAYGSDCVASNFTGRRNNLKGPSRKRAGFLVVGKPTTVEGGVDTLAKFINCIDIESYCGFSDSYTSITNEVPRQPVKAICINCKSIRPQSVGFEVFKAMDCTYIPSNTSSARASTTIVENTTLVT